MSFSTTRSASEYSCMGFFNTVCHSFLFEAGFVRELIQNEKSLQIILKGRLMCHPFRITQNILKRESSAGGPYDNIEYLLLV